MFNPIRALARPMLASMFIAGGIDALRNPDGKAEMARDVTEPVKQQVPALEALTTPDMVRINGAVQVAGGAALATGKLPRLSSAVLAASLVPTTLAGHRFWEETDPQAKANHRVHFLKNLGMLGGLMIASLDREGEPSAAWRAQHAMEHVGITADHTKKEAELAAAAAVAKAKQKKAEAKERTAEARASAKHAAKRAAQELDHQRELLSVKADHGKSQLATKKELAKRKAIPDARNAKHLVDAIRDRG